MSNLTQLFSPEHILLLSENRQLESLYLRKADPAIALMLTRNYNVLTQKYQRLDLLQKAKFWWQRYLKHSTGKVVDFNSNFVLKYPYFKSISI